MERFWNIIHWVIYKTITKGYMYWLKIDPVTNYLYKTEWIKKRFEKTGKPDPMKDIIFALTDKRIGESSYYAGLLIHFPPIILLMSLNFTYWAFCNNKLQPTIVYVGTLLFDALLSYLFNYFLLFRKDKYIKYFRQFEKQPHAWKVKWAWISAGVILFPFMMLAGSFWAMTR